MNYIKDFQNMVQNWRQLEVKHVKTLWKFQFIVQNKHEIRLFVIFFMLYGLGFFLGKLAIIKEHDEESGKNNHDAPNGTCGRNLIQDEKSK